MSDNQSTGGVTGASASSLWKFTLALLLLRLCIGWHFFSEGTKKFSYDEGQKEWSVNVPTERLFRSATGPFANFFKNQLPGFYDWENLLAVPKESKPLTAEELAARVEWDQGYAKRLAAAKKEQQPEPIELPEYAPYKAWGDAIVEGMREKLDRFSKLSDVSDEQDAAAADHFVARHRQLADFLGEEFEAIEEYQHELWRLENLEEQGGATDIPFRVERVAAKKSEAAGLGVRLVTEVRGIERGFENDLRNTLTAKQRKRSTLMAKVEDRLTDPKAAKLEQMNWTVAYVITGAGVCLLLGFFTKVAIVSVMIFLLSVMVTQLPWVAGADTTFFFYQLVEFMALLVLLVSGPWRLPGIDGWLHGMRSERIEAEG
ncbi:MAG: DoxX family protein [Planctomycetota bacterium]